MTRSDPEPYLSESPGGAQVQYDHVRISVRVAVFGERTVQFDVNDERTYRTTEVGSSSTHKAK